MNINIANIQTILLADGWHTIKADANGNSTLTMDVYSFISATTVIHGPTPGVTWVDQKGSQVMYAPLTSVQALTLK